MGRKRPQSRASRRPKGPAATQRAQTQRARAVALHLAGLTGRQIAARLEVTEFTVSDWLQEPWVRAQIEAGRKETVTATVEAAREFARLHTLEALETMVGLMRDPSVPESTRRLAAAELLDRGGVEAGTRLEHGGKIEGGEPVPDLSKLSTEQLLAWKELRRIARGA